MASPLREHRRVLAASLVGTAVEFYDFYVYATAAALVFGPLFFPAESAAAQQLLSFMSFGLAFVARPVGAIAFGHFGDRLGRKSTLVASLLLMGVSTLLIAFLPTYAMVDGSPRSCCASCASARALGSAVNGAGPRCWPSRMRPRAGNRASARLRNLALRLDSSPRTACSSCSGLGSA